MSTEDKTSWRKRYISGEITHNEYYESVAETAGISYHNSNKMKYLIAYDEDKHFNSIPLREWDGMAAASQTIIAKALKKHGDFYSLSCGVCTHKAAARKACEEWLEEERVTGVKFTHRNSN